MVSKRLIDLVEKHEDELTRRWLKEVKQHVETSGYHNLPEHQLRERVYNVYIHLTQWIEDRLSREQVEKAYTALGSERYREGFRLSEVVKALMLAHRNLDTYVREQAIFDAASELHQLVELDDRVTVFFDLAVFCTIKGYEHELMVDRKVKS